jgi:glycosyltransferase involved in cell wall biosynthesis
MPKVSVVSATYNHEKYVAEAIQSVLSQSFQDFELIMTDDASSDRNVKEILKFRDPRITLMYHQRNQGNSVASTNSWRQSRGDYICWLTTDDVYEANLLETFVNYLDTHPQVLGVFGLAQFIDDNGKFFENQWTEVGVGQDRFTHLRQLFKLEHPFCPPAGMVRRSALEQVGYFPPYLMQTNDMALYIDLLFHGEMAILPDKVLRYRWRADGANVSARTLEKNSRLDFELFEIIDLYRKHIDSLELLRKIFPEVDQHPWPLTEDLILFHLAQVAISFNYPSHRMYGMHWLYQLLKDEKFANDLQTRCNFTYSDLFKLEGKHPLIMNHELYSENVELHSQLDSLTKTMESLDSEVKAMKLRQSNFVDRATPNATRG